MEAPPLMRKVDAVTVPVPDLDAGLWLYAHALGHELRWRNDAAGQAGLGLPESDPELVLTTRQRYEPNWLVESVDAAAVRVRDAGGRVLHEPFDIPVGRDRVMAHGEDSPCHLLAVPLSTPSRRARAASARASSLKVWTCLHCCIVVTPRFPRWRDVVKPAK
jgi:predicted enzyme related to lactoylglutathione lyase